MTVLRKITEMVDRDVAANSKPISMIGAALPFVPFMIFVDGAPADRYPILSGLALGLSLSWLVFVMWRMLRRTRTDLEGHGYKAGSARFWRLIFGTILIIVVATAGLTWLRNQIG